MKPKIPTWIMIYGGLFALILLGLNIVRYVNINNALLFHPMEYQYPESVSQKGLYGLFLSRNIAMGIVMVAALIRRSPQMLVAAFLLQFTTGIIDFINILVTGSPILLVSTVDNSFFVIIPLFALVIWIPCAWAIRTLWTMDASG